MYIFPLKIICNTYIYINQQISQLWDLIVTWVFREDIKDIQGIYLMMMMTMRRMMTRWRTMTRTTTTTRATTMIKVSQL